MSGETSTGADQRHGGRDGGGDGRAKGVGTSGDGAGGKGGAGGITGAGGRGRDAGGSASRGGGGPGSRGKGAVTGVGTAARGRPPEAVAGAGAAGWGQVLAAPARGLALFALGAVELVMGVLHLVALTLLFCVGLFFVYPWAAAGSRALAATARRLAGRWTGTPIAVPYLPPPARPLPGPDGWYRSGRTLYRGPAVPHYWDRLRRNLSDQASWRDLLWLLTDPLVGGTIAILPAAVTAYGLLGVSLPWTWGPLSGGALGALVYAGVPVGSTGAALAMVPIGVVLVSLGLWSGPPLLRLHGRWTHSLLAPTRASLLADRVARLQETRAEATGWQASEIRRIERDLHDGVQARLVALGMMLSAAEELVERDPAAAKALVVQGRESSSTALRELRGLIRGILPPVLADRGLADAVRALALDSALSVGVTVGLRERPAQPVESAAYFAVSEALANAARHSGADEVWIDLRQDSGMLRITVTDNGCGGADPARGSGLRGIERRIAQFDGVLAVRSPQGGPTMVTLEIPAGAEPESDVRSGPMMFAVAALYSLSPVAMFPQGLVAAVMLAIGDTNRSWFLALYMPAPFRWLTAAGMIVLGAAGYTLARRLHAAVDPDAVCAPRCGPKPSVP